MTRNVEQRNEAGKFMSIEATIRDFPSVLIGTLFANNYIKFHELDQVCEQAMVIHAQQEVLKKV